MQTPVKSIHEILNNLPPERADAFNALHKTILKNLPEGFEAAMSYGMLGYVVPHRIYPAGYHCKPAEPLPFAYIASQKNSINFYHMGIYANPELLDWFLAEYPKHSKQKLDMGKAAYDLKSLKKFRMNSLAN